MKSKMEYYLLKHYGEKGHEIYVSQQADYNERISRIHGKTESQKKTMINKILPRVALYKAMLKNGFSQENAKATIIDFLNFELTPHAERYQRFDRVLPFFFYLFKRIFLLMIKKDNWVTQNIHESKDSFSFDIVDCLWYNTCVENNCPELCGVFCNNDNILYDGLPNTQFVRSGTIASGKGKCDFNFKKK